MLQELISAWGQPIVQNLDEVAALLGTAEHVNIVDQSAVFGARTEGLGLAFAAGYPLAVRKLTGDPRPIALAVTEARGNGPVDIETTMRRDGEGAFTITGEKTFVTLADRAESCLVLVRDGDAPSLPDGKVTLRLVLAPLRDKNVSIAMMPPLPIAPEVLHGKVTFAGATVLKVFEGDGWNDYGRPFRTIEDVAVMSAALGMVFRITFDGTQDLSMRAFALLVALQEVEQIGFQEATAHVLLAGTLAMASPLFHEVAERAPEGLRAKFQRDLPLLSIANKARAARTTRAWATVRDSLRPRG